MKHLAYLITSLILFPSCATIIARKSYKMDFNTNAHNARIEMQGSVYALSATITANRSSRDLIVRLLHYSASVDYTIKSSITPLFLIGNACFLHAAPAAYLIDFTNQKRYHYGNAVFLNTDDTVRVIRPLIANSLYNFFAKKYPVTKGELYFQLSLPNINAFHFNPPGEAAKINTGFMGISLGFDYGYARNRYINLSGAAITDYLLPFPAAVDYSGEHERMNSRYISLSNNYKIERFILGYGLMYARNSWELTYDDRFNPPPPTRLPVKKTYDALGLLLKAHFQIGERFHTGVIYRPGFLLTDLGEKIRYEHVISVEFAWKIRLKK